MAGCSKRTVKMERKRPNEMSMTLTTMMMLMLITEQRSARVQKNYVYVKTNGKTVRKIRVHDEKKLTEQQLQKEKFNWSALERKAESY